MKDTENNLKPATAKPDKGGAVGLQRFVRPSGRIVCRFSCGAASAVATKLAIAKYGGVEIFYCDPGMEHDDNVRFRSDCERWFGQPITVLKSERYKDTWDCYEKRHFLVGPKFAVCTVEMKKIPGDSVWRWGDTEIYGYTVEERHRVREWRENNFERIIECPLIDKELTKSDCLALLERAGIELPVMYKLGFRNNNCIGCVKARDNLNYWKRVRKHFPNHFSKMAALERELNTTINRVTKKKVRRPIFLDEIEPGDPTGPDPEISCGLFCMAESESLGGSNSEVRDAPPKT